jgi:invasin D
MSDLNVMSGTRSTPPRQALHSEPAVAAETAQVLASSDTFEGLSHRSRQFASLAARLQGRTHATPASASMQPAEAGAGADSAIAQMRGQAEANARWLGQLHGRTERIAGDTVLQRMALLEVQSFAAFAGAEAQPGRALSLSPPESSEVEALQGKMRRQLQALADQPVSSEAAAARASGDFFDSLKGLIDLIGSDYLEVYERLIKQYSDMFSDFNKEVMAKMGEWTKGVNDGKEVEFNSKAFVAALSSLLIKYQSAPTSVVFPVPDAAGSIPVVTKEDAAAWAKAMGLKPDQVRQYGAGWVVVIDVAPLQEMWKSMQQHGDSVRWDSAKFQAWQTGFNTQEAEMKNYLQVATSKYSNANAYHDNFIKIMSSQLSQFAEMLKAYLT